MQRRDRVRELVSPIAGHAIAATTAAAQAGNTIAASMAHDGRVEPMEAD